MFKKSKKGQNIGKYGQKCTKFEKKKKTLKRSHNCKK